MEKCICGELFSNNQKEDKYKTIDLAENDTEDVALKLAYSVEEDEFYILSYGTDRTAEMSETAICTVKFCPFCGKKLSTLVKKSNPIKNKNPEFVTNCYIHKITQDLINKLEALGYRYSPQFDSDCDCLHVRTGYIGGKKTSDPHFVEECYDDMDRKSEYDGVDCGENENLFLAVAGLRNDTDANQWFVAGNDWEKVCDGTPSKYMQLNGHKATLEEIIEYF